MPERLPIVSTSAIVTQMADGKIPEKVNADKFDAVLQRLLKHKPVPKKKLKTSRKKKLRTVL